MRVRIVKRGLAVMFLFLLLGTADLSLFHASKYRKLSDKNCIRLLSLPGSRGNILDRNGKIIAGNRLSYDVLADLKGADKADNIFGVVSRILGAPESDLKKTFKQNYISSSVPCLIARNIEPGKAIALEEAKFDIPSLVIQPNPLRYYPNGLSASHLIGYVSQIDRWRLTKLEDYGYKIKDIVGFGGIEEKYDYYLRQEEGGSSFEVDHRGRFVRLLGFEPPRNGRDIQLTIDLEIQKIADDKLRGKLGAVVVLEPSSGEVIALSSAPTFNPAVFAQKDNSAIAKVVNAPDSVLINRALSAAYPAGSVFKIVVAVAGLEAKKINTSVSFLCQGNVLVARQEFKCWSTHGSQNLRLALAHSCNVFFYRAGLLTGPELIHDYALKFGFSKPALPALPYEVTGFIPSILWRKINKFRGWFNGDTANLSIGQGDVLVTPLQVARMMTVFANGGFLASPYVVKAVGGVDISASQGKLVNLSLGPNTIENIRLGLRAVVTDSAGTGNILSDLPVSVAGKTGTAQAPPGAAHGWFCGFFPFKQPKFVICVFLERGGSGHNACVVAKQIIAEMADKGLL